MAAGKTLWPLLVSCEHAARHAPAVWRRQAQAPHQALGGPIDKILASHRGFDEGARALALAMAHRGRCEALLGEVSRLVVDLNRSLHHPQVLSVISRALPKQTQQHFIARFWQRHRMRVQETALTLQNRHGFCVHLAMHSFTPVLRGRTRAVDIGLLYDPRRASEVLMAKLLRRTLKAALPTLRVRFNQPYRGVADGLPTALRACWPQQTYTGLEIEVNQKLIHNRRAWPKMLLAIVSACADGLDDFVALRNSF